MKINQIVLIGPHGAGKTTLGRLLARKLGWAFHDELGRQLREAALSRDSGAHAMRSQPNFDHQVMLHELARDAQNTTPRVVETWHPGNLAYAHARSPEVALRYWMALQPARFVSSTLVLPLRITHQIGLERLSEPGPGPDDLVSFFRTIGDRSEAISRELGLFTLPHFCTDHQSPNELLEQLQKMLHSYNVALA